MATSVEVVRSSLSYTKGSTLPKKRKEDVSVSFHYFARKSKSKNSEELEPISQGDFDTLCFAIENQPYVDMSDPKIRDQVRFASLIPFHKFYRKSERCVFGTFEAPYSGHSFQNSEKGKIPARSINQREFHYCLYLSAAGRLYVGSQYLGNYGSYLDLKFALKKLIPDGNRILDFAIRDDSFSLDDVVPKEIQVDVSNASDEIHKDNVLGRKSAIVLKRQKKGDEFEVAARDRIIPLFKSKAKDRAKKLANTLNDLGLFSVEEGEITDGKMIVEKGRGQQTIYLFEPVNFATKYNLDVGLNSDGHPVVEPIRKAMFEILRNKILKKTGK